MKKSTKKQQQLNSNPNMKNCNITIYTVQNKQQTKITKTMNINFCLLYSYISIY